jgi:hypothetical protein
MLEELTELAFPGGAFVAAEQGQDLIAEARHEYEQDSGRARRAAPSSDSAASSSRSRRTAAAKSAEG